MQLSCPRSLSGSVRRNVYELRESTIGTRRDDARTAILAIPCLSLFAACTEPTRPTSTSPAPMPSAPREVTLRLDGLVQDSAFRPVAGVTIEVIDGIPAGLAVVTDGSASFRLGDVTVTVGKTKIRASKELFDEPDRCAKWEWACAHQSMAAHHASGQSRRVHDELRGRHRMRPPRSGTTRTYSATFTLNQGANLPPERQTSLNVVLRGASFFSDRTTCGLTLATMSPSLWMGRY